MSVVVAGLGPVGGLLAALLGAQGTETVVVEPNAAPYDKPRAAVLDPEAIRVLTRLPGMPPLGTWATPLTRNEILGPGRRRLLAVDLTNPQIMRIDQPTLEAGLRTVLSRTPGVEVITGRRVAAVEAAGDHVTTVLDDGRRLTSDHLIGCDGTASTVRSAVGIDFPGTTYAQPWLVVDAAAPRQPEPATFAYVLDPRRPAVAMSQPGSRRWEWMLLPGENPATMTTPAAIRTLVADWADPATLELRRAAVFTFHARIAARWRSGRVLLAGDAAHAMPPFAGAGLGMGLRDAVSLAWRLAAPSGTDLDAYERERRPDVVATTKLALRAGRLLQTRNRLGSRALRGVVRTLGSVPGLSTAAGRRPLPPRKLPDGSPMLPDATVTAGDGEPVRLDAVIGQRWAYLGNGVDPRTVVAAPHPGAAVLALNHPHPAPGCLPVTDPAGTLRVPPGKVAVIRPDRFLQGYA